MTPEPSGPLACLVDQINGALTDKGRLQVSVARHPAFHEGRLEEYARFRIDWAVAASVPDETWSLDEQAQNVASTSISLCANVTDWCDAVQRIVDEIRPVVEAWHADALAKLIAATGDTSDGSSQ